MPTSDRLRRPEQNQLLRALLRADYERLLPELQDVSLSPWIGVVRTS